MSDGTLYLGPKPDDAKAICVFVHGRGQSPEMMQDHVISRLSVPGVAYILPRAANGSWYAARAIDALTPTTSSQLSTALAKIHGLMGNHAKPVMLGGFSQGACVVIEYAMKFGPWNGALASLTGCRVGVPGDKRPLANLNGLPTYLTGADADPWIPAQAYGEAAQALSLARARLRSDVFPGRAHEVSDTETGVFSAMLHALISGEPLWQATSQSFAEQRR
jgi:phospholipase/carboxylesterase